MFLIKRAFSFTGIRFIPLVHYLMPRRRFIILGSGWVGLRDKEPEREKTEKLSCGKVTLNDVNIYQLLYEFYTIYPQQKTGFRSFESK